MELKYINKYRNIFLGISLLRLLGIISSLLPLLFHPYQGM